MPCRYEIHAHHRLVVLFLSGEISVDTFTDTLRRLIDDPAWEPGYDRLWDGRDVRLFCATLKEVDALYQFFEEAGERVRAGRTALVGYRQVDRLVFELFSARSARTEGWPVRTFRSREEACEWLGLSGGLDALAVSTSSGIS